jgi:glycosyltransferase involved in cell wall biosynthesis
MRQMVQVIHFIDSAQGSPYFESMSRWLDGKRFASTFLSIRPAGGLQQIARAHQIDGASLDVGDRRGLPMAVVRLRRLLARNPRAVLHAHTFEAGLVAALARPDAQPLLYTRHHFDPHFRLRRPLHRWIDRFTVRRATLVAAPAAAVRDHLIARESAPPEKVVTVENGIEDAPPSSRPREPATVLAVARLHEEKGIDLLIQAASLVRAELPSLRVRIAGAGADEAKLRALVSSLSLEPCVELLGYRRDVPELLAVAAVFCLPSRSEALPVAVLEAMRAGTPIVACAVGGVPEQLADGGGWLVSPTAEALAAALREALCNPERAAVLAGRARRRFEERYTARAMVEGYARLYERLAA